MNKTLVLLLAALCCTPAMAVTATWTGRLEQAKSVTGNLVWNCEYTYASQTFWRAFVVGCPWMIDVQ